MIGPQAIWIVLVLAFLLFGAKKPPSLTSDSHEPCGR